MDDRRERDWVMDCSPRMLYDAQPNELPPPPRQYRQGDVLLIETPPRHRGQRTPERRTGGRWILALGEATGHAHAISTGVCEVYQSGGSRFLDALGPVELVHEEHGAISIAPGTYRIRIQREYVAPEPSSPTNARAWAVGSVRPVRD